MTTNTTILNPDVTLIRNGTFSVEPIGQAGTRDLVCIKTPQGQREIPVGRLKVGMQLYTSDESNPTVDSFVVVTGTKPLTFKACIGIAEGDRRVLCQSRSLTKARSLHT